jgi:hypothetical protein
MRQVMRRTIASDQTMSDYQAYLIRLWRDDRQEPWRAELVSPHTGEARCFATPEQLFSYMQRQMEIKPDRQPAGSTAS